MTKAVRITLESFKHIVDTVHGPSTSLSDKLLTTLTKDETWWVLMYDGPTAKGWTNYAVVDLGMILKFYELPDKESIEFQELVRLP